jgi:hypothetical protein
MKPVKKQLHLLLSMLSRDIAPIYMQNMSTEAWRAFQVHEARDFVARLIDEMDERTRRNKLNPSEKMLLRQKELKERAEQRKIAKKRILAVRYRNSVCSGCYYNRYNFESGGSIREAPTSGDGCFHLESIKHGQCKIWHRGY